jgi:hypothetical protein
MVCKAVPWLGHDLRVARKGIAPHPCIYVPYAKQVVIASTGKLVTIRTPLKPAHFLPVILVGTDNALRLGRSDVISVDQ